MQPTELALTLPHHPMMAAIWAQQATDPTKDVGRVHSLGAATRAARAKTLLCTPVGGWSSNQTQTTSHTAVTQGKVIPCPFQIVRRCSRPTPHLWLSHTTTAGRPEYCWTRQCAHAHLHNGGGQPSTTQPSLRTRKITSQEVENLQQLHAQNILHKDRCISSGSAACLPAAVQLWRRSTAPLVWCRSRGICLFLP